MTVKKVAPGEWWLVGSPRNFKPGDEWLIAHDMFHHVENDKGSIQEEVMSFGAELWLGYPQERDSAISWYTLAGVLGEPYEEKPLTSKKAKAFLLPSAKEALREAQQVLRTSYSHKAWKIANRCAQMALDRVIRDLGHHKAFGLALQERLTSDDMVERYTEWLLLGTLLASQRFPDPHAAQASFHRAQNLMSLMETGQSLKLLLTATGALLPASRKAQQLMKELGEDSTQWRQSLSQFSPQDLLESHDRQFEPAQRVA